ncbi:hypothetical protein KGO95_03650 [Patescibacteria group bacterium]|nr:hypothetical protein [Patescibacteria group bacterium]
MTLKPHILKRPLLISVSLFALGLFAFTYYSAFATVTVTPATGGSAISADTTGGTYTTLTGPIIAEGATADIGTGTIILNVPSGFIFDTGGTAPTVVVTRLSGSGPNGNNINGKASGTALAVTVTSTQISLTITASSKNGVTNSLTWQNVRVRPTAGTPLASGNILKTGTSAISGVTGSTNFGTLTEVAGAKNKLAFTTQPSSTAVFNTDFTTKPVITLQDQFGNTVTTDNSSIVARTAVLSTQSCGGTAGSGTLTSTPANNAAVTAGVLTYTAMQYSVAESIKICATSSGVASALSNAVSVENPVPSLSSISPTAKLINQPEFIMTLTGTNFLSTSQVKLDGNDRATTYVSSTTLQATILASDLTTAAAHLITVTNPGPGGGTSDSKTFDVQNPTPVLTMIDPVSATLNDPGSTMTVTGTDFVSSSVVRFNGADRTTTYVSSTTLQATIPAGDLMTAGTYDITVYTPTPGGGISGSYPFTVNNPVPTLTSIDPSVKNSGDAEFTMTLTGTNFVSTSVVRLNGSDRATTYVSSTTLQATIPASDMAVGGVYDITVFNPAPGGGSSMSIDFTVNNPTPGAITIDPTDAIVGSPQITMTVTGSTFDADCIVRFDSSDRTTTFVSSTTLQATIPASDMASTGVHSITVYCAPPGGGTSPAATFQVENPVPTLTSIDPGTKQVGDPEFTLTLNGTNFVSGSQVKFAGSDRTTTFVSSTTLQATIPASDMTTAGIYDISVYNPGPGGGTTGSQTLIVENKLPTIGSIDPDTALLGSSDVTLAITGTDFVTDSIVRFNGSDRTTTFVSSTTLQATIPASDMTTAGIYDISVYNPGPGGGTTAELDFTVANPLPVITAISPSEKQPGDAGFTMSITGSGFLPSTAIQIEGASRVTAYLSANEVTAEILTSDLAAAGSFSITAVNPGPGGGTSNSSTLKVGSGNSGSEIPVFIRLMKLEEEALRIAGLQPVTTTPVVPQQTKPSVVQQPSIYNPVFSDASCNQLNCQTTLSFKYRVVPSLDSFYLLDKNGRRLPVDVVEYSEGLYRATVYGLSNQELAIRICAINLSGQTSCVDASTWMPAYLSPYTLHLTSQPKGSQYQLSILVPPIDNMQTGKSGVNVQVFSQSSGSMTSALLDKTLNYSAEVSFIGDSGNYLVRLTPVNAQGDRGAAVEKSIWLGPKPVVPGSSDWIAAIQDIQQRIIQVLQQLIYMISHP